MSKCIVIRKYLPVAVGLAAFAVMGTAPAFGASHHRAVHRRGAHSSYASEHGGADSYSNEEHMDPARAKAIHDCNMKAAPYSSSAWQTTQFAAYASCMMDHGQRVQ